MTTIDPTSALNATSMTSSASKTKGFAADSDTFLSLLVANMKNQDPMQPQDSSAYMQQISQITMVEQITKLAEAQQASNALALLGKTVTWTDPDTGALTTGTVEAVNTSEGTVTVDGRTGVDPVSIVAVTPGTPA